ncbi:MAG: hypothetical protein HOF84_06815, partial [Rhodospirillales bacterium]|nr:hypothetical protein [Rhodospirillales bacterium]
MQQVKSTGEINSGHRRVVDRKTNKATGAVPAVPEGQDASDGPLGTPAIPMGADVIQTYLKTLPSKPGVYRMIKADGDVLYVGKAKNLRK